MHYNKCYPGRYSVVFMKPTMKVVKKMSSKHGIGRDARRAARRDARTEVKMEMQPKREPLFSKRAQLIISIVLLVIILAFGALWFYNDSQSFVAKVDGKRINNDQYNYFLRMQQSVVENREGLTSKTEEERKAFWSKTAVEGENPVLSVKNDALNNAKEYTIQLIKAKEAGLKVDDNIIAQAQYYIDSMITQQGADVFTASLLDMGISEDSYQTILQNYYLIDAFKTKYTNDNYTPAALTESDIQAIYDIDPKQYDSVNTRIIYFSKSNEDGTTLDDAAIAVKKTKAEALYKQIQDGASIEELAKTESESTTAKDDGGMQQLSYAMQPYEPEIIDWAYAANMGDVTLLDTAYGIFILKTESRTGFADVKDSIKTAAENDAEMAFYESALDGWMKEPKYNVNIKNAVFDKFTVE